MEIGKETGAKDIQKLLELQMPHTLPITLWESSGLQALLTGRGVTQAGFYLFWVWTEGTSETTSNSAEPGFFSPVLGYGSRPEEAASDS